MDRIPRVLSPLTAARGKAAVIASISLVAGGLVAGCDLQENADLERGRSLFVENCGTCHALTEARTAATIGPDLDLSFAHARSKGMDQDTIEGVVSAQVENPRYIREEDPDYAKTFMPAGIVSGRDLEDVAAYVASVAGVEGIEAPEFIASEYFATNCGGCHALSAAGTTGNIGPSLDDVLPGQTAAQISESISDPEGIISAGFDPGVMPANYGETLTPEQLQALAQYLLNQAGGQPAGAGAPGSSVPSSGN